MSRSRPTMIAAVVSLLLLALATSAVSFVLALAGVRSLPLLVASGSPVLFPFARFNPLALGLMVAQLIVLALVIGVVTALSARGASPRHGFWPVLFGVWLAAAVAGYLAAPVSLPYLLGSYRYEGQLLAQQILSTAGRGGGWGLYYGWIGGIVAGLVHRASNARIVSEPVTRAVPGRV